MRSMFSMGVRAAAAVVAALAVGTVSAAVVTLDFKGVVNPGIGSNTSVGGFYNGGTSGHGTSGTNYGVSFSANSLATNAYNGCCEPDSPEQGILFFLGGTAATVNVAAGFDTGFSFFYSSNGIASVKVFDGLDGTGNLLASLDLASQFSTNCPPNATGSYCNWTAIGVNFAGTARSIDFGGAANRVGFDRITFGSADPNRVPVPATLALGLLGLGLMGLQARRARA